MSFIAPIIAFASANAAGISAVVGAGAAAFSGLAAKQQGDYQAKIAQQNADLAVEKARSAEKVAAYRRDAIRLDAAQKQARGELGFAAGNVALGQGSPLSWQNSLEAAEEYDLELSRRNSDVMTQGFMSERANFLSEGAAARQRGNTGLLVGGAKAGGTLLGEATAVKNLFKSF